MSKTTVLALRVVMALLLLGSLVVLLVLVPLAARDLDPGPDLQPWQPRALVALVVVGILAAQVILVCVWRLVTFVSRDAVFAHASFRYVDVIIGAMSVGAAALFGVGVVLAPGEAAAPGVVLLVGGVGLAVVGVTLVTLVLRALLGQAVALDVEARHLQSELDEVI